MENEALYSEIEAFIRLKGYNILNKTIDEEKIHIFVQTNNGLEELMIDDELLQVHILEKQVIFKKLNERDLSLFTEGDLIKVLEEIENSAKKGAYIQRYKGLGR